MPIKLLPYLVVAMSVLSVYKTQQLFTKPTNVLCKNNLLRLFLMDGRWNCRAIDETRTVIITRNEGTLPRRHRLVRLRHCAQNVCALCLYISVLHICVHLEKFNRD